MMLEIMGFDSQSDYTTGDDVGDGTHELAGLTAEGSESLVPHHPHVQVGHTARETVQLWEPPPRRGLFKTHLHT